MDLVLGEKNFWFSKFLGGGPANFDQQSNCRYVQYICRLLTIPYYPGHGSTAIYHLGAPWDRDEFNCTSPLSLHPAFLVAISLHPPMSSSPSIRIFLSPHHEKTTSKARPFLHSLHFPVCHPRSYSVQPTILSSVTISDTSRFLAARRPPARTPLRILPACEPLQRFRCTSATFSEGAS